MATDKITIASADARFDTSRNTLVRLPVVEVSLLVLDEVAQRCKRLLVAPGVAAGPLEYEVDDRRYTEKAEENLHWHLHCSKAVVAERTAGLMHDTGVPPQLVTTHCRQLQPVVGRVTPMSKKRSRALKNAWTDRVGSWDDQVESSQAFSKVRDALLEVAQPRAEDEAVDLGAGTGFVTIPLAERARSVIAVDLVQGMLDVARQEAEGRGLTNVTTITEDLSKVDLDPASVDLVISSYALHHLTDGDKIALVERARAWLRPGGRIVIADMMFGRGASAADRRIILDKVRRLARKGPGGLWRIAKNAVRLGLRRGTDLPVPPDFWIKALTDAGFSDVNYTSVVSEAGIVSGRVTDR